MRTYHTGATRKRILPVLVDDGLLGTGDITYHPPASAASQKSRPAGKVLSVHESGRVGLGVSCGSRWPSERTGLQVIVAD